MIDEWALRRIFRDAPDFQVREIRRKELEQRHDLKLPNPGFFSDSIVKWMMNPKKRSEWEELLTEAGNFFEPLRNDGLNDRSTCVYKQVGAQVRAYHEDLFHNWRIRSSERIWPRRESVTKTERYSGLHEDLYDQAKFPQKVRWSWLFEAAELALQASGRPAKDPKEVEHFAGLIWDQAQVEIRKIVRSSKNMAPDPDYYGFKFGQFEGIDCASITQAVRELLDLADFKFCPIGKFGGSPNRDRWEHCPSVCAERGALAEWHRILGQRLIKDPKWEATTNLALFTTAVPCYLCAMGMSHEPGLNLVVIGSIKQRAGQPYLNTDDRIALDILAQTFGGKENSALLFYDLDGTDEYVRYVKEIGGDHFFPNIFGTPEH